jgi:anthranilate synthase component 2
MNVFLLDNYDSFTYMLRDYIEQCGAVCTVKRNDEKDLHEHALDGYDAIVISPGPKTPDVSGITMDVVRNYYRHKPILGVCLGHQAIGEFFGARLVKAQLPRHGKVDPVIHNGHPLFDHMEKIFPATRYHSLVLEEVIPPLQVIARSEKNEVMAVAHQSLPVYGIQFHPESCMTEAGIRLIKNFLVLTKRLA